VVSEDKRVLRAQWDIGPSFVGRTELARASRRTRARWAIKKWFVGQCPRPPHIEWLAFLSRMMAEEWMASNVIHVVRSAGTERVDVENRGWVDVGFDRRIAFIDTRFDHYYLRELSADGYHFDWEYVKEVILWAPRFSVVKFDARALRIDARSGCLRLLDEWPQAICFYKYVLKNVFNLYIEDFAKELYSSIKKAQVERG